MSRSPSSALASAIGALARALRKTGRPHMILGGIAIVARGVARVTRDVDATIWAPGLDLDELVSALRAQGIEGRTADFVELARENLVLFLEHARTRTPIELLLGWLPFELEAMQRAELVKLGSTRAPVAQVEDLIVYKALAWQERDRADVERLLELHGGQIDLARVRSLVAQLAEALDHGERVAELDALIRRAVKRGRP